MAFFVNLGLTVFFGVCSYPDKTEEEVVDPSEEDERQQHQEQRWTLAIRSDMVRQMKDVGSRRKKRSTVRKKEKCTA